MQPYGAALPTNAADATFGVPLEAGERILFIDRPNYTADKVILWIFGVLFAVVLIGILFIVMAVRFEKTNPRGTMVTNRRVIHVKGSGEVISIPLADIVDLDVVRQRSNAGAGGLIGVAVSAGVNAIQNSMANKKSKSDPKFWNRAIAVVLVTQRGRTQCDSRKSKPMGVFLANALPNLHAIEQYPSVS